MFWNHESYLKKLLLITTILVSLTLFITLNGGTANWQACKSIIRNIEEKRRSFRLLRPKKYVMLELPSQINTFSRSLQWPDIDKCDESNIGKKKWVRWRSDVYHRIIEIDKERDCAQQRGCWLCRTWRCRATMVAFDGCFGHDFPERRPDHTPAASVTSPLLWRRSIFHLTAHSLPISTLLTHGIVPTSYRRTDTIETVLTTTHRVTWLPLLFTIETLGIF